MNKRLYSLLIAGSMVFSMLPVNILAEEVKEEVLPECDCKEQCTSEEEAVINSECPVCGIENADLIECIGTPYKALMASIDAELSDITGKGYSYTAATKTLTIISDEGNTAWLEEASAKELQATITTLVIEEGVNTFEIDFFKNCKELVTMSIPHRVTTIMMNSLYGFSKLRTLTVAESNTHYKSVGNVLFSKDGTQLIIYPGEGTNRDYTIPAGVTSIKPAAFYENKMLTSVNIPSSVTSIGTQAFYRCTSLENVAFASNNQLISIENFAFIECNKLTSLILPSIAPTLNGVTFPTTTWLYIPVNGTGYDEGGWAIAYKDRLTTIKPLAFTDNASYDIPISSEGISIAKVNVKVGVNGDVNGGTRPYIFTATGLPAGITITSAGVISGKPTAAGAAGTATITVTDSASPVATQRITINYGEIIGSDIDIVSTAKAAVEGATFANTTQAIHANETAIKNYVKDIATTAVNNPSVGITVTTANYTAPIAGTSASPAGTNGSYVFTITVSKGNQSQITTSKTITIAATPYSSSGGSTGGSSSGSITVTPPSMNEVNSPIEAEIMIDSIVDDQGHALVKVYDKMMRDAISEAKKNGNKNNGIAIVLNVETGNKAVNEITVNLPKLVQEQVIKAKIMNILVVVDNPDIQIMMNLDAVTEINKQAKSDVSLNARKVTVVENRPAFELTVNYGDDKQVEDLKKGNVSVSIPYTLQNNEFAGNVYAVYLDENNQEQRIEASSYDSMEKVVRFSTNHFSTYGVGYKQDVPTMSDIANYWAKEEIEYVVSRGLLVGSSDSMFYPDLAVTRDMLVSALAIMSDIDEDAYLDWAIKNKLLTSKFSLEDEVSREEMAMILNNYAKSQGFTLPRTRELITFSDDSEISNQARSAVKAMQMAGVMMGKDKNKFDPTSQATRAEVSVAIKRYNELLMDLRTAQGFDKNDSGSVFYYEAGKPVTGDQTILGKDYEFGKDGILIKKAQPTEQWVADGKHWYYMKEGVTLRNSWIASDAIGSKWYYVNNEGQMVRSTIINGFTIGYDGVWIR